MSEQPIVSEPDQVETKLDIKQQYLDALENYQKLNPLLKANDDLEETKAKLDKLQTVLADPEPSDELIDDVRFAYEQLQKEFIRQVGGLYNFQVTMDTVTSITSKHITSKEVVPNAVAKFAVPVITGLAFAFVTYALNKTNEQRKTEENDQEETTSIEDVSGDV